MTSSLHGVDELGYKCATREMPKRCNNAKLKQITKSFHSSNCSLQLECMKEEWIVIVVSYATVNNLRALYTLPVTLWEAKVIDDLFKLVIIGNNCLIFKMAVANRSEVITR